MTRPSAARSSTAPGLAAHTSANCSAVSHRSGGSSQEGFPGLGPRFSSWPGRCRSRLYGLWRAIPVGEGAEAHGGIAGHEAQPPAGPVDQQVIAGLVLVLGVVWKKDTVTEAESPLSWAGGGAWPSSRDSPHCPERGPGKPEPGPAPGV